MARPDGGAPTPPKPAHPHEVTLSLGEPVGVVLPLPRGELRVVMPGARYALQVDSELPVYLSPVERQDPVQIRPREDLVVKAVAVTIQGQPGQEVGLLAAPRRAEALKPTKSPRKK